MSLFESSVIDIINGSSLWFFCFLTSVVGTVAYKFSDDLLNFSCKLKRYLLNHLTFYR